MALTDNQNLVLDMAACLFTVQIPDSILNSPIAITSAKILAQCDRSNAFLKTGWDSSWYDGSDAEMSLIIRNASSRFVQGLDRIVNFIGRARTAGFDPPDNPIEEIRKINKNKRLVGRNVPRGSVDAGKADDIIFNYKVLLALIDKEKEGVLNLEQGTFEGKSISAQMSSMNFNMDGYDLPRTDSIENLVSFLPDADAIKRIRVEKSLSSLSFKNRIPRILFTMKYEPDTVFRGAIVGWRRIADASSYTLKRVDIFTGETREFVFHNEELEEQLVPIKNYVVKFALNFYRGMTTNSVWAILDDTVEKDKYYTYTLIAHQNIKSTNKIVLYSETAPVVFSKVQLTDIEKEIDSYVKNTLGKKINDVGIDDVSPYPFLSKKYYGDEKYDWVLSYVNMTEAKKREEKRSDVRRFSYLGSRFTFISQAIEENKLKRPHSLDEFLANLRESLTTHGVSAVLKDVIQGTGLDLFFEPKESFDDDTFTRATNVFDSSELNGLQAVLSSIDASTATVSVRVLTQNLLDDFHRRTANKDGVDKPIEINVFDSDKFSEDPIQFVSKINIDKEDLDLTTFEGIGDFVRIIRLFFDTNPNRTNFGADNFEDPNDPTVITVD